MKFKIDVFSTETKSENSNSNFEKLISKKTIWSHKRQSILSLLLKHKIPVDHSCGGNATCGTCVIQICEGELNSKNELETEFSEERGLNPSERLSCQSYPLSDIVIKLK